MNLPAAPRRPSRVVAVALLLALHLVALDLIAHLQTTRDRVREQLTSLRLLDMPSGSNTARALVTWLKKAGVDRVGLATR